MLRHDRLNRFRFKIGLAHRLFFAFLAVSLITAIGVGLATRWSFQQGILAYLDEREVQRIEAIALALGQSWEKTGNWNFIRQEDNYGGGQMSSLESAVNGKTGVALPPGFVLYDRQWNVIAGREDDSATTIQRPVKANGKIVGTLFGAPRRSLQAEASQRFWQYHLKTSWLIGITITLMAATLAFLRARGYVQRIEGLIAAITELGEGNYAVRVLEKHNDEITTFARSFNAMAAMLQSNELMRRQFMADVSHELRTPLSVLCAELEAMKDGIQPITLGSIRSLEEETLLLTRLVNDIRHLSLAEVGALQYNLQALDLADLIAEEQCIWQEQFSDTGLTMEVECQHGLLVRGDHDRLHQVLRNLIDNTRRHAGQAGLLRLLLYREDGRAVIECHDDGPGVAEGSMEKLFNRFWRDDRSRNRNTGGSGLGLAICRSIVVAHGGKIRAERSPLGGLCVRVFIPLIGAAT